MTTTYNGQSYPQLIQSMVCFTNIPNILTIQSASYSGTPTTLKIRLDHTWQTETDHDNQWYITIDGDTVYNTITAANATGKRFYIAVDEEDTAFSLANALRNCQNVYAKWLIEVTGTDVTLTSRENGNVTAETQTNAMDWVDFLATGGTNTDQLYNADVYLNLYDGNDKYLTTVSKHATEGLVRFNVSPLVSSLAEYGKTTPFKLKPVLLKDGETSALTTINSSIAVGYKVPGSSNYLGNMSGYIIGQQLTDGSTERKLYTFDRYLNFSLYNGTTASTVDLTIQYLDSAGNVNTAETLTVNFTTDTKFADVSYTLNVSYFTNAYAIKVIIPNTGYILYNVIKPLKSTSTCKRLTWRNEYGGISFFDFTIVNPSEKSLEAETYNKTVLDYYTVSEKADDKIYGRDVETTYSVSSHLIPKAAIGIFDSLAKSQKVWTSVSSEQTEVIVTNIAVEETDVQDIYRATVEYRLSVE